MKLDVVMVEASMGSENATRTTVAGDTPVALTAGSFEVTIGGLLASSWMPGPGVSGCTPMSESRFVVAC